MAKIKKRADGRYRKHMSFTVDGKHYIKDFYSEKFNDVERMAREYKNAVSRGLALDQHATTLETIFDNLISAKKAKGIGIKALNRLRCCKKDMEPLLQRKAMDLHTSDFQERLNELGEWHDGHPPLSHWTLANLRATTKSAYDLAIPEIVQYNPIVKTITPAGANALEREPLDDERQHWVTDTPHRAQRAAMLMMYSGLRRGEATALTWADVDLDAGTITVSKSYDFASRKIKEPKTKSGIRVVNIPTVLVTYLGHQKDGCLYVLHNAHGKMMTETSWRRMWDSYMIDLNIKYGYKGAVKKEASRKKDMDGNEQGALPMLIQTFTPHQLRHTFCTLLYFAGVDVMTARDQMGHKDIKVTLGIYTKLDKKYKRRSMQKLDNYLLGSNVWSKEII